MSACLALGSSASEVHGESILIDLTVVIVEGEISHFGFFFNCGDELSTCCIRSVFESSAAVEDDDIGDGWQ